MMKISQAGIDKINKEFNKERYEWESYYASQHHYRLGILDTLKALGVSDEQINLIDTEGCYKEWKWEE